MFGEFVFFKFCFVLLALHLSKFKNRLDTWTRLSSHPQFVLPRHTKIFLPRYLQTPAALSCLPKKTIEEPINKLLLTTPKGGKLLPRKLSRYKSF